MSKQSEAKAAQGYDPKPVPRTCASCAYFTKDVVTLKGYLGAEFTKDKNLRCGLGGFAVKKMATCSEFIAIENLTIEIGIEK